MTMIDRIIHRAISWWQSDPAYLRWPPVIDRCFAWRPVQLSTLGNAMNVPDPNGCFLVDANRWAWLRRVERRRGLFLSGPVYLDIPREKRL